MRRFYVNALGLNNAVGSSVEEVYKSLFLNSEPKSCEYSLISGRKTQVHRVTKELASLPVGFKSYESRNNQLLMQAVDQIRPVIDGFIQRYGERRIAIVLGTSTSGILETEQYFHQVSRGLEATPLEYYKQEISNCSDFLAEYLGLKGLRYTVSTACTSSAKAFIEGRRLLQADLCDAVIVGGVDTLSSLTLDGFDSLDSVAPGLTNPFSKNRSGINIGEGAAVFVLSCEPDEIEFLAYGESSDAHHISAPDPTGEGAEIALRAALKMAMLSPKDIGYINLHGTGTPKNDLMESVLVSRIFGSEVIVSTTKPLIGHTLGAAGAQEAAICILALSQRNGERRLPIQVWDQEGDPELPKLSFVKATDRLKKDICMSNSFAFGGNNVSLIFSRKNL